MSASDLPTDPDLRADRVRHVVGQLHHRYAPLTDGSPADYIRELASVDPDAFAISVTTADGRQLSVGDADESFTIQSISKPMLRRAPGQPRHAPAHRRTDRRPNHPWRREIPA